MLDELDLNLIQQAARRIRLYVLRTPVFRHEPRTGATLFLKAESLQEIGAFKIRGAFSLMSTLPRNTPGVVAHSSGNHAQAVARAARVLGLHATIVMPSSAPHLKRVRTEAEGAEVVLVGSDSDERIQRADSIAKQRGFIAVPPYDHPLIAAGQGTAALELLEEVGTLDRFYAPISGGGLMAGCATAIAALAPACEIIGVEPERGDDTLRSLRAGSRQKIPPPVTLADGLCVRIPGELTWPVIQKYVARVELVTDDELLDTMAFALSRLRIVLEPSGAAALAVALREGKGRCGVILSGGNVDSSILSRALDIEGATGRLQP